METKQEKPLDFSNISDLSVYCSILMNIYDIIEQYKKGE